MRVVWRPRARTDRLEVVAYIALHNPAAAIQLNQALVVAADSLATFPDRGRLGRAAGTRELVAVWPYIIVYEFDAAASLVRILRIWHGAQDRS
jgi:plasmid stabilization system protein ParE